MRKQDRIMAKMREEPVVLRWGRTNGIINNEFVERDETKRTLKERERNDDDDDEEIRRERNAKGDKCAKGVGPWQFPGRPPLLTINYIFVPSC